MLFKRYPSKQLAGAKLTQKRLPLGLIYALMILPWLWVWLGWEQLEDWKLTIALYAGFSCLLPVWIFRESPFLPPFKISWKYLLVYIPLFSIVCNGLVLMVWHQWNHAFLNWADLPPALQRIHFEPTADFLWFALYLVGINPLVEELFWRQLIYRQLKQHYSCRQALWISAFFFSAWHWLFLSSFFNPIGALVAVLLILLGGVLFGLCYERSQCLSAPILLHAIGGDIPLVCVFYWALQHP